MDEAWPWLLLAGSGALHGLNPASGWIFAAACGPRAMLPLAAGHLAAVAGVALAMAAGASLDRFTVQATAALLLALALLRHLRRRKAPVAPRTPQAGLALWSFIVSAGHGAGWMLAPALMPLCAGTPGSAGTALAAAVAAAAVHLAAMLGTGALLAAAARVAWRGPRSWR